MGNFGGVLCALPFLVPQSVSVGRAELHNKMMYDASFAGPGSIIKIISAREGTISPNIFSPRPDIEICPALSEQ